MQRDKISKQKCSSNDPVSFRSSATKPPSGVALSPPKTKKSKGKSSKKKAKNLLDCNPPKSSDSGIPFDDAEMEISENQNESPDSSKKACNKNEKLATSSKQLGDVASVKEKSKNNSSSPNGEIQTKEEDDVMDEDNGDEYDVPATESEEDERVKASKKSQSESDLSLETTEDDNTSQEEQEVEDEEASVDNEDEGSKAECDDDENENNESSGGESEHLTAEDFVDQEAEEGSETDDDEESIFESEITLSSDEEKKEALFEGGSRMASGTAPRKSDQRYDDESDDLGGFIVDDDFIEPMSDDEAADHPDVCLEDDARTKKHKRIVIVSDSSDSEASEIELGSAPKRGKKPPSEKKSQSSVKVIGAGDDHEQATGGKQDQDPNLELSSAKSKRKKAKDQMLVSSEQEASTSKVPRGYRIPDGTARQVSNRLLSSTVPRVSRPLRSPKLASPVRPRLSRLDEFRISKGLSPAVKRREARDGSENWVVSDVRDSMKTSAANLSQPSKKYAKLVTLSKKEDTDDARMRVLKRSRCESESPIPRKKSRRDL